MAKISPVLAIVLLNSVVALGAVGLLVYTKVLYKRPVITEASERDRIEAARASPAPMALPGTFAFEPITVNIEATPASPRPADGTARQLDGKLHYAKVGLVLELRDESKKPQIEEVKALILDKFLSLIGRKNFRELTTVQGRYLLKTQLLEAVNQIVAERSGEVGFEPKEALVTNIFFSEFLVQ